MNRHTVSVALLAVLSLSLSLSSIAPVAGLAATDGGTLAGAGNGNPGSAAPGPCTGTIERPANGTTIVSVQGAYRGNKTVARQIAFGPNGEIKWMNPSGKKKVVWSYDVDPMPNGHLFVTSTRPGRTLFFELDPQSGKRVWETELDMLDTHDADLINGGEQILIANMRNYDKEAGRNNDRLAIYDRDKGKIVWQWRFANHYNRSVGGKYKEDWTHVNDVDKIGDGLYLASPRNLDQSIVVNRTSGEIEMQLGEAGNTSILNHQHNPDYLESEDGDPTMLVADSENKRIVEYERTNGSWNLTWTLGNKSTFSWPRDADRLPNGNTLITDSRNHRVLEVTPDGEVVWEVYTPYLPYDAERIGYGGGSNGPTIADQNASIDPAVTGAAGGHTNPKVLANCDAAIKNAPTSGLTLETKSPTPSPGDGTGTADDGDGDPNGNQNNGNDDGTGGDSTDSSSDGSNDGSGTSNGNGNGNGDGGGDGSGTSTGGPGFGVIVALVPTGLVIAALVLIQRWG